jgi:hypothetical protein
MLMTTDDSLITHPILPWEGKHTPPLYPDCAEGIAATVRRSL